MKISKLFHWLYALVMFLPVLFIPVFMIYTRNENSTFTDSVTIDENQVVDFNQLIDFKEIESGYFNSFSLTLNGEYDFVALSYNFPLYYDHYYLLHAITDTQASWSTYQVYFSAQNNITCCESYERIYRFTNQSAVNCFIKCKTYSGFSCSNIDIKINLFDLTQMYGAGLEPSAEDFLVQYSSFYNHVLSDVQLTVIGSITYNDSDIGAQFMYSSYNYVNKYFNYDNVFNFSSLYDWLQLTYFNGNATLGFFVFWHLLIYWLLTSLIWLIFDVLMYVPLLIHRWLDKAALS